MRVLVLTTDAFGGRGGIAKYNRDMLEAFCSSTDVDEVVALPRVIVEDLEVMPRKLRYETSSVGGKGAYVAALGRELARGGGFDVVVCGHINLLALAYVAARRYRAFLALFIYGIDAWQPHANMVVRRLAPRVDKVVSISDTTLERFRRWVELVGDQCHVLPNAFDPGAFGPGPKPEALMSRYQLHGKTVLMTFGRMSAAERYKGFDEVLELLPRLRHERPDIKYLAVGDGNDRARLEAKAAALRITDLVIFTGRIEEAEKADHYRLADAYVMPSRGEGFGFVLLEAMACGIPSVGSKLDGTREALRDGRLGILVDPSNRNELLAGVLEALARPRGVIPNGLEYFSFDHFEQRAHALLRRCAGVQRAG